MKKFGLLLFSALVAFSISAQEVQNVSQGTVYLRNKASDNWYIGLGGGTTLYMTKAENDADANFGDRLGWMGQLEFGRWNSPNWGAVWFSTVATSNMWQTCPLVQNKTGWVVM